MSARFTKTTFTAGPVNANSSLNVNQALANRGNIGKVRITPNIPGGASRAILYKESTRTTVAYRTALWTGSVYYDPCQDESDVLTDLSSEGFVAPYENTDADGVSRWTFTNGNLTQAVTYTVEIWVEDVTIASKGRLGLPTTGSVNGSNRTFNLTQTPDTSVYAVILIGGFGALLESSNGFGFTRTGASCALGANVPTPETGDPQPVGIFVAA